jgi:diguanylate cyclase (GGDEF)-like protein
MSAADDEIFYADDDSPDSTIVPDSDSTPWKILITDDSPEIHDATRMVLADIVFRGRALEFLSAYSGAEARAILETNPDIAVIFLDVVMEHDNAGLDLVEVIRRDLKNENVRIILRTGQPGQAPERQVIVKYDINDYKNKSELTVDKLFSSLISALRSYQDMATIAASRRGLERILDGSLSLLQLRSTKKFLSGVLLQLDAMFHLGHHALLCARGMKTDMRNVEIITASGQYETLIGQQVTAKILPDVYDAIMEAFNQHHSHYEPGKYTIYFHAQDGLECVIYIYRSRSLSDFENALIEVFCTTAAVGLTNINTLETLEQKVKERTQDLQIANRQLEEKAKQLELIASTDALTGIHSRRHFFEVAEALVYSARRYKRPLAMLILDIDHFKKINDQFGHAAGDRALQRTAQVCACCLRESDTFGRLGGEEFVIALAETDAPGAINVANRIRDQLKLANISFNGEPALTVSIGISLWQESDTNIEVTIQRADAAMYDAKRNGRNRVEVG